MKAVILAAGEGVRMRPLTETTPKPMLEILGRPILEHIFDALPSEVTEVILVVGYLQDQIKNYFGEKFGKYKIHYISQAEKSGTGHALGLCKNLLGNERFLMLYADDLQSKKDIENCLLYPFSILVKEVEDPRRFGVIVADKENRVIKIVEKPKIPPSKLASTGVCVLDSRIFNYHIPRHENGEYYITDAFSQLIKDHEVKAVHASFWIPIGYPVDLAKAEDILTLSFENDRVDREI